MKIKIHKNLGSRGFTLIELLVVIAIIGILSSVVLASLNTARVKGQDAARMADVKSLKLAIEMYYNDFGGYPTTDGGGGAEAWGDVPLSKAMLVSKLAPYITMPALLIADGDHYYANSVMDPNVSANYDMLIYIRGTNSWCRTGTLPNQNDWGVPTVCNF